MNMKNHQLIEKWVPALRCGGFRAYLGTQFLSSMGAWAQSFTLAWVGMQISDTTMMQGVLGFATYIPMTLLTLPAGALIDRMKKRSILLFSEILMMVLSCILAAACFAGWMTYGFLLAGSITYGVLMAFDLTARHTFIGEMVPGGAVRNALALNATASNIARILGPLAAGFIMQYAGTGWALLFNALTFIPFIGITGASKSGRIQPAIPKANILRDMAAGFRQIAKDRVLLRMVISAFVVMTLVANYNILIPLTARDSLGLSEAGGGILMMWIGIGAILGSVFTVLTHGVSRKKGFFEAVCFIAAACTLFTGFGRDYLLTVMCLLAAGFTFVATTTLTNASLQDRLPGEYRGRAVSVYSFIFAGSTPIGNLVAASMAEGRTPWHAWFWSGIACLGLLCLIFALFIILKRAKAGRTNGSHGL